MKAIFEGSPNDIRSALIDINDLLNRAKLTSAEAKICSLEKELKEANDKAEDLSKKLVSLGDQCKVAKEKFTTLHNECTMKTSHLARQDALIQELSFKNKKLLEEVDARPQVSLSEEQEAEVEKVFQKMIKENGIVPPVFQGQLTPRKMIEDIFASLAIKNRVAAIKSVRMFTGMGLLDARDIIDNALRAFGVRVNEPKSESPKEEKAPDTPLLPKTDNKLIGPVKLNCFLCGTEVTANFDLNKSIEYCRLCSTKLA